MEFLRWNAFALEDELHEAMKEVGWKPWATSRHVNRELFMKEMIDAWHFFMNLLLAVSPSMTAQALAEEFADKYYEKNRINEERQAVGYDGVESKCRNCGRDLEQLGVRLYSRVYDGYFCDRTCIGEYGRKVKEHGTG